ncbi:Manganese transport protein MntH [hydrothermal vent metagenome]|uniref:Manganese transport protein MntH n=1 Tax=hydrothermal vent metagenome TaxID=652676 RepID=A0A3B0UPZ1_9ZZZZ
MSQETARLAPLDSGAHSKYQRLGFVLAIFGPGLVVMLADTDVGSLVTAAQSGARWGYKLLLLQLILIPVLYVVQELTVRLGVHTGRGHGELIRDIFGAHWAWISVTGLVVACFGALITEFSGVASIGLLFGVPHWISLSLAAGFLLLVVWTGSYKRVERIAVLFGLFELVFFWIAFSSKPDPAAMVAGLASAPFSNPDYRFLIAANIGAVIMPWMIFYQQSAIADKGLAPEHYKAARWDTALGALLTQMVMAAVLVATAATIGRINPGAPLETIGQIVEAFVPFLGENLGKVVFSAGVLGAAFVAAIVVSLATAWGLGEVTGYRHSLQRKPARAPWFYAVYTIMVVGGALVVAEVPSLVSLNLAVEVMNALLLPLVLGLLYALAMKALPESARPGHIYRWVVLAVVVMTSLLGVYAGLSGVLAMAL